MKSRTISQSVAKLKRDRARTKKKESKNNKYGAEDMEDKEMLEDG